jgi:Arc/MetJ-type ribon-helix-helix transcriptional regulator
LHQTFRDAIIASLKHAEDFVMSTLTDSLSETNQNRIDDFVRSGKFRSPDEFVTSAIKEALRKAEIARINSLLREGLECTERIEATPEFWAAMRQDLDEYIKQEGLDRDLVLIDCQEK